MKSLLVIITAVLLSAALLIRRAEATAVFWAVDDSQKVRSDQVGSQIIKDENGVPLSQSPLNQVWQDGEVHIFGGRNEIIAFQVIAEAVGDPLTVSSVTLDQLCRGSDCLQNSGNVNDPFDYRGKQIEIFTPHYVNSGPYVSEDNLRLPDPYYQNADLPEIMIPINAPAGATKLPLTIPTNTNRSFWFDITTPRDLAPGVYTGTIQIATDEGSTSIPVKLTVYDFTLPDKSHFPTMFYYGIGAVAERLGVATNSAAYYQWERQAFQLAYRHRAHLFSTLKLNELISKHLNYVNGSAYTAANQYAGPGAGAGHGMYPIGTYDLCDSQSCFDSRNQSDGSNSDGFRSGYSYSQQVWWDVSDAWYSYFKDPANGLSDRLIFRYMVDEPNWPLQDAEFAYGQLHNYADWMHANPGPGSNLKSLCSAIHNAETTGYCDGYVFNKTYHSMAAEQYVRSRGGAIGMYNGSNPTYGAGMQIFHTAAADARVTPWVASKYGVDFYFLWQTVRNFNRSKNCEFYANDRECVVANMLYPGTDPFKPANDPQIDGPLASVRLKFWRRGMQDYEYLWLLKQSGKNALANQVQDAVVPRGLYEAGDLRTPNSWSPFGYAFEAQRKIMALALSGTVVVEPTSTPTSAAPATATPSSTPPPGNTATPTSTNTPPPGATVIATATSTAVPTASSTPPPAATSTPTATPVSGACLPDPNNALANPGFENGVASWSSYFASGSGALSTAAPAFECDFSARIAFSGSSSNMQVYQTDFTLQPDTDYVLSFAATSNSGHDLGVYLQRHTKPYTSYGVSITADLTASWQVFSIPFRTDSNPVVPRLRFWFSGNAVSGDVYWLDDVRIVPAGAGAPTATNTPTPMATNTVVPTATNTAGPAPTNTPLPTTTSTPAPTATNTAGPAATKTAVPTATSTVPPTATAIPGLCAPDTNNVLANPGFEDGTAAWSSYFANNGGVFSAGTPALECERSAQIVFSRTSNNMQLYQNGFNLQPDTEYVLSFAAASSSGRDLEVYVQRHTSPYTNYGVSAPVNLSSSWQVFSFTFTTPSNPVAPRLRFWFSGNAQAGDVYGLDDVRIVRAGTGPTAATNTPVPAASSTPLPTGTNTPIATATATPLATATKTPLPTATNTAVPGATSTLTPAATATATTTPPPAATSTPSPTPTTASPGARVATGLLALYTFEQGAAADTVYDVSGAGAALNLTIAPGGDTSWLAGGGLALNGSSSLTSGGAATKVINAATSAGALTVEAWVRPLNVAQDGPARIVSLSSSATSRNFTLGQGLWGSQPRTVYDFRLRTTGTDLNGTPSLTTAAGAAEARLQHIVATFSNNGQRRLYVDGVLVTADSPGGTLTGWSTATPLLLGNEADGGRPWLGEMHLVAIYGRALSDAEVSQNFTAGARDQSSAPAQRFAAPFVRRH